MSALNRGNASGLGSNYQSELYVSGGNRLQGAPLRGSKGMDFGEGQKRGEIISRIEGLFPFLQDIIGQNDARSNTIINRLIGLRENLDQIFEEMSDEVEKTEEQNEGLRT